MPQLDMSSWLNNVVITTAVMLSFYTLLSLYYLTYTTAIFKGRTKLELLRQITLFIFKKELSLIISVTTLSLTTLMINNMINVWQIFAPTNNNIFKTVIDLLIYDSSLITLEDSYTQLSIINNANEL